MADDSIKVEKGTEKEVEEEANEETTVFDPRGGLTEEKLALRDQLEEIALEYAQNDAERAWLTDMCLFRYLRARDWKLEKAEKMLKATMDWRREWDVDAMTRDDVIQTLELKSFYRNGKDMLGRPIMYIKPVYNDNPIDYRIRSSIYSMEESIESMDESSGIEKMCLIADFDRESQKKSPDGASFARKFLSIFQNNYPERLGIFFALNPPWFMRLMYSIISPFIDPVTKKKIHFLTGNKDYIKNELLKYIDEDQLETKYGGTRLMESEPDVRHARQSAYVESALIEADEQVEVEENVNCEENPTARRKGKKSKKGKKAAEDTQADHVETVAGGKAEANDESLKTSSTIEEEEEEERIQKKKKSKKPHRLESEAPQQAISS